MKTAWRPLARAVFGPLFVPGLVLNLVLALVGCSGNTSVPAPAAQAAAIRNYSGTASVGDFLTISINSTANTITYKNYTNGDTGTVPYIVNANGTYAITDPERKLDGGI